MLKQVAAKKDMAWRRDGVTACDGILSIIQLALNLALSMTWAIYYTYCDVIA